MYFYFAKDGDHDKKPQLFTIQRTDTGVPNNNLYTYNTIPEPKAQETLWKGG